MAASRRLQKINRHIQRTFGEVLLEEADVPPEVLMTVTRVDTTPNLKSTKIWLSIYPVERASEVLKHLTPQLYDLQGALNRKLDVRPLPRVLLRIDYGAQHAEQIEHKLADLAKDAPKTAE